MLENKRHYPSGSLAGSKQKIERPQTTTERKYHKDSYIYFMIPDEYRNNNHLKATKTPVGSIKSTFTYSEPCKWEEKLHSHAST